MACPECQQETMEPVLRMRRIAADRGPQRIIGRSVNPGKHDRAVGLIGKVGQQIACRRAGGGKSCGDDGVAGCASAPGGDLPIDQPVPPRRGVNRVVALKDAGPGRCHDFQEFAGYLPMLGKLIGDDAVEGLKSEPLGLDLIQQPTEIAGEYSGLRGQDRPLAGLLAPVQDQPGQQQSPAHLRQCRWDAEAAAAVIAKGEVEFLSIEIAKRQKPGQQGRVAAAKSQKRLMQSATGAARRQNHADSGKTQRCRPVTAIDPLGEAIEERLVPGDGEDVDRTFCHRRCPGSVLGPAQFQPGFHEGKTVGRADMIPFAVMNDGAQATSLKRGVINSVERESGGGRIDKELRRQ